MAAAVTGFTSDAMGSCTHYSMLVGSQDRHKLFGVFCVCQRYRDETIRDIRENEPGKMKG